MNIKSIDLRSDAAENSIMQTITIAVSAILIAAGLVTAPGLINNARDNNATTDLANVAYAEEFNLANTGEYATIAAIAINTQAAIDDGGSAAKLTRSGGTFVQVSVTNVPGAASTYSLFAISQSGKVFLRTSEDGSTPQVGTVTVAAADRNELSEVNALVAADFTVTTAGTAAGVVAADFVGGWE